MASTLSDSAGMYDSEKIFASYLANSNEKKIFAERLIKKMSGAKGPLKILDVGCHDGAFTAKYLESLSSLDSDRSIQMTCLDPSQASLNRFRSRILPSNVQVVFYEGTIESFFTEQPKHRFDWIVCSHSLYWSKDLRNIIEKLTTSGHHIVIVMRNEQGIREIQLRFRHLVGNPQEQFYSANNIEDELVKLQVPFVRESVESTIHLPTDNDLDQNNLICFFLQTSLSRISKGDLMSVKTYLKSLGSNWTHSVSFFWLGKTAIINENKIQKV